jgi:hypothetical protein
MLDRLLDLALTVRTLYLEATTKMRLHKRVEYCNDIEAHPQVKRYSQGQVKTIVYASSRPPKTRTQGNLHLISDVSASDVSSSANQILHLLSH